MKPLKLTVALCGLAFAAFAQDTPRQSAGAEETCGQKISENAKYPQQLSQTLTAISEMNEQHAKWIGSSSKAAKGEQQMLKKLSSEMRDQAEDATELAQLMRQAESLPAAEHDMRNVPPEMLASMERARDEQRRFGQLLLQGAQEMDQQINQLRSAQGVGGAGMEGTEPTGTTPTEPLGSEPSQDPGTSTPTTPDPSGVNPEQQPGQPTESDPLPPEQQP